MLKINRNMLFISVSTAFLMLVTACLLNDIPLRDVANRYAPMAEALGSGNFAYAFHLRVPPLHNITSGGIVYLTGIDGFSACKAASMLWYFAGMFLLYKLMREIYPEDKKIPILSVALYAVFPYTSQMVFCGMREPVKTFVFLLAALSLIRIKRNARDITGYIMLGIACGFSALTRSDMIIMAGFFLFAGMYFEYQQKKFPVMSVLSYVISQMLILPNIYINKVLFNDAMPDFRFAVLYAKITQDVPDIIDFMAVSLAVFILTLLFAGIFEKITRKTDVKYFFMLAAAATAVLCIRSAAAIKFQSDMTLSFLESLLESFHSFFGLAVLVYLVVRSRYQKLSPEENIAVTLVVVNALINISAIQIHDNYLYLSSRYLQPALPLLFGFFVCAVNDTYFYIEKRFSIKYAKIFLAAAVIYIPGEMIFHTFQPIIRSHTRKKNIVQRQKILKAAEIIKNDFKKHQKPDSEKPALSHFYYLSDKRPRVYVAGSNKISVAPYIAGGCATDNVRIADYMISDQNTQYKHKNVVLLGSVKGHNNVFKIWRVEK